MSDTLKMQGIGARIPRMELPRLLSGKGRYLDDIRLPHMLHAYFIRSPHAHAVLRAIHTSDAKKAPGVVAVYTGDDLNPLCEPFIGAALHRPGHRSPPQPILVQGKALWQGQPVAVILAKSRALAEDAAELVELEWDVLDVALSQEDSLSSTAVLHEDMGDNLAFDFTMTGGDPDDAFAKADIIIEEEIRLERQSGLTLETRGIIADYNRSDGSLTVWHSHQSPFQMHGIFSRHLRIPDHKIRFFRQILAAASG